MKRMKITIALVLLIFCASFMGCGGGARVQSEISTTSLGQELTDLEKAYEAGIINQKEYERAKKGLMKKYK
jgi:hypothetical protein